MLNEHTLHYAHLQSNKETTVWRVHFHYACHLPYRWQYRYVTTVLPTFLLIFQAFSHFTYVTAHSDSPSFPSLHVRHSSFSNPSLALPMSQFILQPFRCFTYVTAHSPTLLSPLLRHRIFTYVTWRAAHAKSLTITMFSYFLEREIVRIVACGDIYQEMSANKYSLVFNV